MCLLAPRACHRSALRDNLVLLHQRLIASSLNGHLHWVHVKEQSTPVQHLPVPQPLPGHLCEQCLDAPAVVIVPAPWGGEMGVCDTCHQAPAVAALPILTAEEGQQTIWHTIRDPERLAAYRVAATVPLPAWWDRCVSTAPARVCACGSYRLRWGDDDEM